MYTIPQSSIITISASSALLVIAPSSMCNLCVAIIFVVIKQNVTSLPMGALTYFLPADDLVPDVGDQLLDLGPDHFIHRWQKDGRFILVGVRLQD